MKPEYSEKEIVEKLKTIKAYAIDQDGTTYLEHDAFPWTVPFLDGLKARGKKYLFLSNNSSKSRSEHRKKLLSLGINATYDQILSSSDATIEYLKTLPNSQDIFLMATPSVEDDFSRAGFKINAENPNYVVLAYDLGFNFQKLERACNLVRAGVPFIATHEDNNWMIAPNLFRPDVGALAAAVTAATGIKPKFIGKPNKEIVDAFLTRLNLKKDQVAIIGDRLNIDIRMGNEHGILSILVLSGKTRAGDVPDSPFRPDFVLNRSLDILHLL